MKDDAFDLVFIGGGPAGLSGALRWDWRRRA